jgi:ATP-dependent RNA helicase TDRD9
LEEEIVPEMLRSPLETTILRVKCLDFEDTHTFLAKCISPPDKDAVVNAMMILKEVGGLRRLDRDNKFIHNNGDMTLVGKIMAALPIDVRLSKMIVLGYTFSVLNECIIIAAGLCNKSIFRNNYRQQMEDYKRKLIWANGSSCDLIAILNAYKLWQIKKEEGLLRGKEKEEEWCRVNYLDRKGLHEMNQLIHEIKLRLTRFNLLPNTVSWTPKEKIMIIKVCFAGASLTNFFFQGQSNVLNERDAEKCLNCLNPYNTVYFQNMDRNCVGQVYAEQIKNQFLNAKIVDKTEGIKVSFDSEKMFVQFPNLVPEIDTGNYEEQNRQIFSSVPGKIAPEVYKSLKYRKINATKNAFELQVMSTEDTQNYAIKKGIAKRDKDGFKLINVEYKYPEYHILPNFNVNTLFGKITHIDHCNKFYFQPEDPKCTLNFIENSFLEEELNYADDVKVDKLVIVEDGTLKRAKIVFVYENFADCFFFDYGYVKKVSKNLKICEDF